MRTKYNIDPVRNKHVDRNTEIIRQYERGLSGIKLARDFKLSTSQAYRIINQCIEKKEREK
jgi:Mor family transcriptional regulator